MFVTVGTDAARSRAAIELAAAHADVWATVGLHPHDATQGVDSIVGLLDAPRVVAVGEAGLDYHYDHSPREVQREAFAAQIALAHERDLTLVIHTREAWDDTFAHPRRRRRARRARSSTASPAVPTRRAAASTSAPTSRSRAS